MNYLGRTFKINDGDRYTITSVHSGGQNVTIYFDGRLANSCFAISSLIELRKVGELKWDGLIKPINLKHRLR